MVILDTNVISELMDSQPDAAVIQWLDRQSWSSLWTTSITILEVRYGLTIMVGGRRRTQREAAFARLIAENFEGRVVQFDHAAAEETALLMAARHRIGRRGDLRDNMIAGIALAQRATLATRNVRHFDDLTVPVVNPWHA
jgi:predicted nucleic acid-binding protein